MLRQAGREKKREMEEGWRREIRAKYEGSRREVRGMDVGGKSVFQKGGRGDVDSLIAFHEQGMILICSRPSAHVMVTMKNKYQPLVFPESL